MTTQTLRERANEYRTALRRLEKEAHRYAEAMANGDTHWTRYDVPSRPIDPRQDSEAEQERYERALLERLQTLMDNAPGLFINLDPRGYALKVQPEHAGDLPKDWGGYGLVAPDN